VDTSNPKRKPVGRPRVERPTTELVLPAVLTEDLQQRIVNMLGEGNYLKVACEAAGTTYWTYWWWRRRWSSGDPETAHLDPFFRAVDQAIRIGEGSALRKLRQGAPGWQAQAWFLERRFPQRWGKQDRTPLPPKPNKPIDQMTDDEFERYRQEVEGRVPSGA
jgi:hypothetical protein